MTSVAVIVLDSLRKDTFDDYFRWLPGQHFENVWSTSHYTIPVHASLFTGLYPSEAGVTAKNEKFDVEDPVLTEILQESGYTVRGFSENFLFSPVNDFDRGFDEFRPGGQAATLRPEIFDWKNVINELDGSGPLRDLRAFSKCIRGDCRALPSLRYGWKLKRKRFGGTEEIVSYLKEKEATPNEFFIANLMTTHLPYRPPRSYRSISATSSYLKDDAEHILAGDADYSDHRILYEDCARYLSDSYRDAFEVLSDRFDYVITMSDHGDLFGEYGAVKHWFGVYPELIRVPLVISGRQGVRERRTDLVSLLDVHRTIAEIAGIDVRSRGNDLRTETDRSACIAEFSGLRQKRIDRLKQRGFTQSQIDQYDQELYGIACAPDYYGFETPDGFRSSGTADDPRETLSQILDSMEKRTTREVSREEYDEIKSHLSDLGYR